MPSAKEIALSTASAQNQMNFQERMSNTAHQREVADLQAAGLNPVLSAKLGGASTPSGAEGDYSDPNTGKLIDAVTKIADAFSGVASKMDDHSADSIYNDGNYMNDLVGFLDRSSSNENYNIDDFVKDVRRGKTIHLGKDTDELLSHYGVTFGPDGYPVIRYGKQNKDGSWTVQGIPMNQIVNSGFLEPLNSTAAKRASIYNSWHNSPVGRGLDEISNSRKIATYLVKKYGFKTGYEYAVKPKKPTSYYHGLYYKAKANDNKRSNSSSAKIKPTGWRRYVKELSR